MIVKFLKKILVMSAMMAIMAIGTGFSEGSDEAIREQYQYDTEGRLVSKITPDGNTVDYKYNDRGLLTQILHADGATFYEYDANGNRIQMRDQTGSTRYCCDAFDRLIGVLHQHSPSRLIIYDYDPWDNLSSISIYNPDLMEVDPFYGDVLKSLYRWDPLWTVQQRRDLQFKFQEMILRLRQEDLLRKQRWQEYQVKYDYYHITRNLKSVDFGKGRIEYSYRPERNEMIRQLPNGIKSIFSYLPSGELNAIRHEDRNGKLVASYQYEYDPPGKVSGVIERTPDQTRTTSFNWGSRGYLKSLHTHDGDVIHFGYDRMGNRLWKEDHAGMTPYKYDNFGRIIQAGDLNFQWNKNGSLIKQYSPERMISFQYDARNLPTLIQAPDVTAHYKYDGDRNLIGRELNQSMTHYLPDPLRPSGYTLAEYDRTGNMKTGYIYGGLDLLGHLDGKGRVHYYLEDGFSSIRAVTDPVGKIVGRQDFSPFAELISVRDAPLISFRKAGERYLPETDTYNIAGRLYEPATARYIMPDPLPGHMERFDSFNRYAHGCRAPGLFMEPRCNQTSKRESDFLNYINRPLENWYPGDTKGAVGGGGIKPLPGERVYANVDDPFSWWPFTLRNVIPVGQGGVGFRFLWLEWGPGIPKKQFGVGGHTLREGYKWTGEGPSDPDRFEVHSLGDLFTYDLYRGGGYAALEPLLGKTIRGAGHGPLDVGENEIASGSYLSNFLFDAVAIGLPRTLGLPVGRDITVWPSLRREAGQEQDRMMESPGAATGDTEIIPDEAVPSPRRERSKRPDDYPPPPPPPNGGDGPGAAFIDPFQPVENRLGGIELAASGNFIGDLGAIEGVAYDPEKECIVLVGTKDLAVPSINTQDLAVAYLCVSGPIPQDPQFSLDPADPRNPEGEWLKAVYIPENIVAGTAFGKAMFEADWLLKQYSFGVSIDPDGKLQQRECSVSGFKSTADLSLEEEAEEYESERWARFWIVSDSMELRESDNAIYFDVAKMRVKARKQVPDPSSPTGLRDVDTEDDPVATKFANLFTELYDEIARESPEFERIRELAKAVALAKWLKTKGVPLDLDWMVEQVNSRIETVGRITALSVEWERQQQKPYSDGELIGIQTLIHQLRLFGGIDLSVRPKWGSDDGKAHTLEEKVTFGLRQADGKPLFAVERDAKELQARVLPITKSGQEMWDELSSIEIDGIVYQFNDQKKVTKSTGGDGGSNEYIYDSEGKLKAVKVTGSTGWNGFGERDEEGSLWTITNPRGNTFKYRYGNSGYLNQIEVDEEELLSCDYDEEQRRATIRYKDYVENRSFDADGYIQEYELGKITEDRELSQDKEWISLRHDDRGRITKMKGSGIPAVEISRHEDKQDHPPDTVTTIHGPMQFSYDPSQRIEKISLPDSTFITFSYESETFTKMEVSHPQGTQAEYIFGEDGVVKSRDFLGGAAEYSYEKGALSSVRLGQSGQAEYIYDDQNRLQEMRFPDGSWIEYQYQDQLLSVITHPSPED